VISLQAKEKGIVKSRVVPLAIPSIICGSYCDGNVVTQHQFKLICLILLRDRVLLEERVG
jgi:hypothetical protein